MDYEELELQYSKTKDEFELFKNIVKPNSDPSTSVPAYIVNGNGTIDDPYKVFPV